MFINESFLSFVWQYTYFNVSDLILPDGQTLEILFPGNLNANAGPDFTEARIRISDITWIGAVEIHVKSSHWQFHQHQKNADYNKVVLHVVWENDQPVMRQDQSEIPTLALTGRVSADLIDRFRKLIYFSETKIACSSQLKKVNRINILNMIEKALIIRLERRAMDIFQLLNECNNDWDEITYRCLARNFGFKVNQENMFLLSKFLPLKILLKHSNDIFRLEALLFGTAGFLDEVKDGYQLNLKKEYYFLKHKYRLDFEFLKRYQWKFLRLHPQNFPPIRISQLAVFLSKIKNAFSYILNVFDIHQIYKDLSVIQSEYWQKHYDFGETSKMRLKGLGRFSIANIIINSFVPILYAYGKFADIESHKNRAILLLDSIPFENNKIMRYWNDLEIEMDNAADSQGLIELYNNYCYKKQCLNCNIGTEILLNSN